MQARYRPPAGPAVELLISAGPLVGYAGRVFGAVVTLTDNTERAAIERRLRAHLAVTRILAESTTLGEATPQIIEVVCTQLAWDLGEIWSVDARAGIMRYVHMWHVASLDTGEFDDQSRHIVLAPGVGLAGRAWARMQPEWSVDVTSDSSLPRAGLLRDIGLRAGFAFPIVHGGSCLGAMAFYSRERRRPDQDLLHVFAALGSLLGQFIERTRAEGEIRIQQKAIQELSTPVLQVRDRLLILPIIGVLDARRASHVMGALLRGIRGHRAQAVVVDVTGVAGIEGTAADHLLRAVEAARLLGATVILTGISRATSQALVELGVDVAGIRTAGDLQSGIDLAERLI